MIDECPSNYVQLDEDDGEEGSQIRPGNGKTRRRKKKKRKRKKKKKEGDEDRELMEKSLIWSKCHKAGSGPKTYHQVKKEKGQLYGVGVCQTDFAHYQRCQKLRPKPDRGLKELLSNFDLNLTPAR